MEKRTTGHILRLNLVAELTHGMCVSNLAFQVACEMDRLLKPATRWQWREWSMISESLRSPNISIAESRIR